jgi:F-type H+-transporting ATPase subunit c
MKIQNVAYAIVALLAAVPAIAEETATAAAASTGGTIVGGGFGMAALGLGIMMAVAVLGGTLGQSRAAAAALDGIARNPAAQPKIFVPLLLALALMESLVLFALIIGLQMSGALTAMMNAVAR